MLVLECSARVDPEFADCPAAVLAPGCCILLYWFMFPGVRTLIAVPVLVGY